MKGRKTLVIDPTLCDAHGVCSELFPEWVARDPWGYPIVDDHPVPDHLLFYARKAVRACPRVALSLVEGD